jgi:hypothetical protein
MGRALAALLWTLSAVAVAQEPGTTAPLPPFPADQPAVRSEAVHSEVVSSDDWSLHSGKTMGEKQSAVAGQAGWPGIQTEYMYGLRPFLDLGGRFEFDWSFLGDTKATAPGIKLQGIVRLHLLDAGRVVLSARFEPGFMTFFFSSNGVQALSPSGSPMLRVRTPSPRQVTDVPTYSSSVSYYGTLVGITLPVGLEAGMPVAPGFLLNAKFSVPFTVTFGDLNGGTIIPLMFGVGMEYRLEPRLSLVVDLAAGPIIYVNSGTDFALNALAGVAYKL